MVMCIQPCFFLTGHLQLDKESNQHLTICRTLTDESEILQPMRDELGHIEDETKRPPPPSIIVIDEDDEEEEVQKQTDPRQIKQIMRRSARLANPKDEQ